MLGSDQVSYGATDSFDTAHAQPDERELQRERDALYHITVHATEYVRSFIWNVRRSVLTSWRSHMIDVLHPNESNLNHNLTHTTAIRSNGNEAQDTEDGESGTPDAEEEAWLASIAGLDTTIKLPQKRALVLDVAQLRQVAPRQGQTAG